VHQRDDPVGDEDPDAVEGEEQQGLAAPVAALAVPERPELVADEGKYRGQDVGQRRRPNRAQPGPGVEDVDQDQGEHEREAADNAELGDLVDQYLEARIEVTNESHRGVVSLLGPSRIDPTLSRRLLCYGTGGINRSRNVITPG
jgi:hypothetical protein